MANSQVHTGYWVDHSRGHVLGATITLEASWGSQLVSAAAILVQIIGLSAWTLLAFAIHQTRSVPGSRDEFDAQLQVLLRNTWGADSAAWNLVGLAKTWKGRRPNVWRSALPLALIPFVVYTAFILAGIFVGQIATNSYDRPNVLLQPGACGFVNISNTEESIVGYSNLNINISSIAKQYARACYSGAGSISAISCSVYPVSSLGYEMIHDEQPCPVPGSQVCFPEKDDSARPVTLKTKVLDSHDDFGINAPPNERMHFQYQTTCAPLSYPFVDSLTFNSTIQNDHTNFGTPPNNATLYFYNIGNYTQYNGTIKSPFAYAPVVRYWGTGYLGYAVTGAHSLVPHNDPRYSAWSPASPFNETQGDLTVLYITPNSITYTDAVEDPMFRTFADIDPSLSLLSTGYVPMRNTYFLACREIYQICNPWNQKCTGWNTTINIAHKKHWRKELGLNEQQHATYIRLASQAYNNPIVSAFNGVPDSLLATNYLLSATGSRGLPKTQWRTEVEGWFQTVLSRMQFEQNVFVNIPLDLIKETDIDFVPATKFSSALAKQCNQQRVAAPQRYQSYNLFGLAFIAFFGLLIPGLAIVIRNWHHKLPLINPNGHRYLSYNGEGLMQLHRMALEGAGYGGWEGGVKKTPKTGMAEVRLPQVVLDEDNSDGQPILRYPKPSKMANGDESGHQIMRGGYHEISKEDSDIVIR